MYTAIAKLTGVILFNLLAIISMLGGIALPFLLPANVLVNLSPTGMAMMSAVMIFILPFFFMAMATEVVKLDLKNYK